jgi:hypothetical protein
MLPSPPVLLKVEIRQVCILDVFIATGVTAQVVVSALCRCAWVFLIGRLVCFDEVVTTAFRAGMLRFSVFCHGGFGWLMIEFGNFIDWLPYGNQPRPL